MKCLGELLTLSLSSNSRSKRLLIMFFPAEILAQVMLVTTVILQSFFLLIGDFHRSFLEVSTGGLADALQAASGIHALGL